MDRLRLDDVRLHPPIEPASYQLLIRKQTIQHMDCRTLDRRTPSAVSDDIAMSGKEWGRVPRRGVLTHVSCVRHSPLDL